MLRSRTAGGEGRKEGGEREAGCGGGGRGRVMFGLSLDRVKTTGCRCWLCV